MKPHKIKSLLYLSGFIIAAVIYYNMEQQENFLNAIQTSTTADIQAEDLATGEESEEADKDLD